MGLDFVCWTRTVGSSFAASRYGWEDWHSGISELSITHLFPQRIVGHLCGTQLCEGLSECPGYKQEKPSQTSIIKIRRDFRLRIQNYLREPNCRSSCLRKVWDQKWKRHQERGGHSHPHSLLPLLSSSLSVGWCLCFFVCMVDQGPLNSRTSGDQQTVLASLLANS